jgi:hypothetical protein
VGIVRIPVVGSIPEDIARTPVELIALQDSIRVGNIEVGIALALVLVLVVLGYTIVGPADTEDIADVQKEIEPFEVLLVVGIGTQLEEEGELADSVVVELESEAK